MQGPLIVSKRSSKKSDRTGEPKMPGLSDEDVQLWQHIARTLRPFHGRDKRILPGHFDEPGFQPHASNARADNVGTQFHAREPGTKRPSLPRAPAENHRSAPQLAKFDNKKARKIRAGRIDIEARLDLHGMRQAEAHRALRSFLLRAQARDLKWVLVITGKGTFARDGDHPDPLGGDWDAPQRGILRRNVPRWLAEPDMRALVVSYTTAALHHGGEGALYIQLRTRKK